MPPNDPQCNALGVPAHLHTCGRVIDPDFDQEERLYRRHKLDDRQIKTVITFKEMSVNREKYSASAVDVLLNTRDGGRHEGYGVVSFPVRAIRELRDTITVKGNEVTYDAVVVHEPEPCNFSHTVVIGRNGGTEQRTVELPKTIRKNLRKQLFNSVVTEVPAESAGKTLND